MIYAKLDVRVWSHPKFIAAGPAACGFWMACLAYLREQESSDGRIPSEQMGLILGLGGRSATKLAQRLVDVGLFAYADDAYMLLRYAEKNETKEVIAGRKSEARIRAEQSRSKRRQSHVTHTARAVHDAPSVHRTSHVTHTARAPSVPIGSGSGSGSLSPLDLLSENLPSPPIRPGQDPAGAGDGHARQGLISPREPESEPFLDNLATFSRASELEAERARQLQAAREAVERGEFPR